MITHTNDFINEMKNILLDEKKRVEKQLISLKAQDPYTDTDRVNDNAANDTEAKEESDHERVEALEKEMKNRRDEVSAALHRIEEGSYGICDRCRKRIEEKRLRVNPAAIYCLSCEKLMEK